MMILSSSTLASTNSVTVEELNFFSIGHRNISFVSRQSPPRISDEPPHILLISTSTVRPRKRNGVVNKGMFQSSLNSYVWCYSIEEVDIVKKNIVLSCKKSRFKVPKWKKVES